MRNGRRRVGEIAGLEITADKSVLGGAVALFLVLTLAALKLFRLSPGKAVAGGLIGTAFHVFSELWHQGGHARAARQTGYPMEGVDMYAVLGTSRYPADEPPLPSQVHIQRALGGPRASAILAAAAALLALFVRPGRTLRGFISLFLAIDNLTVFTIGAMTPLPLIETDGSTILRELRGQRPHNIVIQE